MDKEEGEMSDDNAMIVDEVENPMEDNSNCTLLYRAEKTGIVVETLEKVDSSKLEERAKRFGLNLTGSRVVTQSQIDELYAKSGIESGNERHFRFDSIHLHGVDGLTTREIFEYLEDFKPVSLEWADDISCNVVCQDHISAALALLVHSREINDEELIKVLSAKSNHHWREGLPHPKKDIILLRFATNGDKKLPKKKPEQKYTAEYYDQSMDPVSKNPWGDLCKSWGVYDHQEVFNRKLPKIDYEDDIEGPSEPPKIKNKKLAMRLGKRSHEDNVDESGSDSEWKKKSKTPRMRMHADDEESKIKKKKNVVEYDSEEDIVDRKPLVRDTEREKYAPLSIEVVNTQNDYIPRERTKLSDKFKFRNNTAPKRDGILSRLGSKVVPTSVVEASSSDEYSSDDNDRNIMSRVQKVGRNARTAPSVWSRLDAGVSKEKSQRDLRQMLKSRKDKDKKQDDLRERISKAKKTNLRIEIDNI